MTLCHGQHAASPTGRVVQGPDGALLAEEVVVFGEQQVHHEFDDFSRREVLASGLVGLLGEPSDELLVDVSHLHVVDGFGMQIDLGETLGHPVEQV